MNRLKRNAELFSIAIILTIVVSIFFTFYFPVKKELESSYLENFMLLSNSKIEHMKHFAEKSIDGAKAISSRTAINNKIIEYKDGKISLDELKDFTKSDSRYEEAAKVFDNIIGSVRLVDHQIIAEYGTVNYEKIDELMKDSSSRYNLERKDGVLQMAVYSQILNENGILGYDLVFFDISNYLEEMIDEKTNVEFLHQRTLNNISRDEIILQNNESILFEYNENIGYLYKLHYTDEYIYIYTSKNLLYGPAKKIVNISYAAFIISLIGLFVVIRFIILKNADKIFCSIEASRNKYKEQAYKDSLTGAYSRVFLDTWVSNVFDRSKQSEKTYSIAMVDGDRFKEINDKYGHSVGDKVIIKIAEILQEAVREEDHVIRYGGDEFLVIFDNCKIETAHSVFERVKQKLSKTNELEFNINISYGIYEVSSTEDFYQALNKADKKMYDFKQKKDDR